MYRISEENNIFLTYFLHFTHDENKLFVNILMHLDWE
jgi:hypothetical protein